MAHAIVDRDVLNRLHEKLDSLNPAEGRFEPADQIRRAYVALVERLQVDRHSSAVGRRVRAVGTDEGRKALDRGVRENRARELLLLVRHGPKADGRRGLGDPLDHAGVLHRE